MSTIWVLIVWGYLGRTYAYVGTAEFTTEQRCIEAAQLIKSDPKHPMDISYVCVKK